MTGIAVIAGVAESREGDLSKVRADYLLRTVWRTGNNSDSLGGGGGENFDPSCRTLVACPSSSLDVFLSLDCASHSTCLAAHGTRGFIGNQ